MEKFLQERNVLQQYIDLAYENMEKYLVVIVGNVTGITQKYDDYTAGSSITDEYYTLSQYNRISSSLQKLGFSTLCYFDEMDFIYDILTYRIRNNYPQKFIVLNFAQKGLVRGRKSLIPVFCDMNNIIHTNSNGFACSFAREKYYWGLCLQNFYNIPNGWLYDNLTNSWVAGKPVEGTKVIAKLCNQSSSIGLESQESVFVYKNTSDKKIKSIANSYHQPVLVQECISGKEVEVPVFFDGETAICLPPSGIKIMNDCNLNDQILTSDIRCHGGFMLFNFDRHCPEVSLDIRSQTAKIVKLFNLQGICRIDYRINAMDEAYVMDINCNPHLTETSSVHNGFRYLGFKEYSETLLALLGHTIKRSEASSLK